MSTALPFFLLAAIPVTASDLRDRTIPNGAVVLGVGLALWWSWTRGPSAVLDALVGGIVGAGLFGGIWLLFRGRMGLGDVKFAAVVGAFCGTLGLLVAVFISSALGLLVALVLISQDRRRLRMRIPYAPFLSAGGAAALLAELVRWPALLFGRVA